MFFWSKPKPKPPTPYELFMAAIAACDRAWAAMPTIAHDEIIRYKIGVVEYVLFSDDTAKERAWKELHPEHEMPVGYCFYWAGANTELVEGRWWVQFKRLPGGDEIIAMWASQHELQHLFDLQSRLRGREDEMSDPDDLVNPLVWKGGEK